MINAQVSEEILKEIKASKSVLLHCHPSPDPDSVGSVLAMKFALEQLGKKVTIIRGDSEIPQAFMHFPGAESIITKNFFEIDAAQFDLFVVLDSSLQGISRIKEVVFPPTMKVVNIDHHRTNTGCGSVNLVDPSYPSCTLLLYDLFKQWGITIDANIAPNLFIGAYTDTGGFKYEGVTTDTFRVAGELAAFISDLPGFIAKMENSTTQGFLKFQGVAFDSIEVHLGGIIALSSVTHSMIVEKELLEDDIQASRISTFMRTVPEWKIVGCAVEIPAGEVKISLRSADSKVYDVSKLAQALGGGGHKAAAGCLLKMSMEDAIKKVVETAKILYNL